ncbi:MAG: hypothetical protein E6R07_14435 [Nevskiaceae bacterium]|nr:MAG: hypothetical protein E6R07_14435 [Nevskiaceae bacterium]
MPRKKKPTPDTWRSRIVGEGEISPADLLANPYNFRVHSTEQGRAIDGALDEIGWIQRVIVNRTTGHVVDGHLRVSRALRRNEPTIPVVYVELTENEERIALATLDPIAAMAGTDADLLNELLAQVEATNEPLLEFLQELQPQLGTGEGGDGGGKSKPEEATTVWGEIIALGQHRLLCGDIDDDAHRLAVTAGQPGAPVLDIASAIITALARTKSAGPLFIITDDAHLCDSMVTVWEAMTGKACERLPPV